jgi:hypothetical protein
MTQPSLLDWRPPKVAPHATEQSRQLARVSGRIAEAVIAFCRTRQGETFFVSDLASYVMARCGGAPASADRVLRALRKAGHVDVECIDRGASLYRVVRA